jgi:ParB-like chromosome segregation protein Spo0J
VREDQPISNVVWIRRDRLAANDYNPNRVAGPEMKLLRVSILEDGWTQPIVARTETNDDGMHEIIDGFHRWTVSGDKDVYKLTDGMVPVVLLPEAVDQAHQRMSTVRHNRARGSHYVVSMAEIVEELVGYGLDESEIGRRLQMEPEEIRRLREHGTVAARRSGSGFSRAWEPTERVDAPAEPES